MDGYWIASYSRCSSPMCQYCHLVETRIVTEATDFIPFFVQDLPWQNLSVELGISAVVSLIFAVSMNLKWSNRWKLLQPEWWTKTVIGEDVKMADRKKISKENISKNIHHYYMVIWLVSLRTYANLQYLTSMLPIVEEMLSDTKEEEQRMLWNLLIMQPGPNRSLILPGSLVVGRSACKRNTVDGETISSMRAGLMGPIAGGDSLVVGTLIWISCPWSF